jgi:hypothetical protein
MRLRGQRNQHEDDHGQHQSNETQYLVGSGDGSPFAVVIEPEGMEYSFPPHEKVLLTLRPRRRGPHYIELVHRTDSVTIWRPSDTEVWATLADGTTEQIGGWAHIPAPWIDSDSELEGPPPWTWPPAPR